MGLALLVNYLSVCDECRRHWIKSLAGRNVIDGIDVANLSTSTVSDLYFVQDWEPLQHMMHDYKGMVSSWSNILGLYHNTEDKHKVHSKLNNRFYIRLSFY